MTRVWIVTTARLLSDLIQVACQNEPDLEIIGTVQDKTQALANAKNCDVMLVNHDHPDVFLLLKHFGYAPDAPAVVILGVPPVEPLVLRYIEAGAAGCVREQESAQELVQAIRLAARRQIALHADMYPLLLKRVSTLAHEQREANPMPEEKTLTPREREILHLIAQGYPNREIARQLAIELGTTKNHVHNILDKLNVKTRREAAVFYSLGLVTRYLGPQNPNSARHVPGASHSIS